MARGGGRRTRSWEAATAGRAPFWKLPVVKSKELGKLGPDVGLGAGCGVGFGFGLFGGAGLGLGNPSIQLGFGLGAGCGVGTDFGYGPGKGVVIHEHGLCSNMQHVVGNLPSQTGTLCVGVGYESVESVIWVATLLDEFEKMVNSTSRALVSAGGDDTNHEIRPGCKAHY